jgi:hypothetical protein
MTAAQRTAISSPATGLLVYQTDSTEGFYQYASTGWSILGGGGSSIYTADGTLTSNRTLTLGGFSLTFAGSRTATGAIARGLHLNNTLVAAANNDVLVGLDISPTFTNGAFTGVTNYAARLSDNLLISKNQNGFTETRISNTTSGTGSYTGITLISDTSSGSFNSFKTSSTYTTYKTIVGRDAGFYNSVGGDFSFLNDWASGKFKWAMGASSTAQMTLTAAGRLLLGTTTEGTDILLVNGTSRFQNNMQLRRDVNSDVSFLIVNVTGGASSSVQIGGETQNAIGFRVGVYSPLTTALKIISSSDTFLYNYNGGDIAILNNFSTGKIKFAAGASSTVHLTIKANGSVRYQPMATPSTAEAGDVYYDSSTNKLRCYNGTTWNDLF